ncbi:MAG: hypothetical protein ACK5DW_10565 [Burkholderiales bacterium]
MNQACHAWGVHRETAKTLGAVESKDRFRAFRHGKGGACLRLRTSKHEVVRISICQRTANLMSQVHV